MDRVTQSVALCSIVLSITFLIALNTESTFTGASIAAPYTQKCLTGQLPFNGRCCDDANTNEICDIHETDLSAYCEDKDENNICDGYEITIEEEAEVEPFKFHPRSTVASKEGYSIALDEFAYEAYEDWGKVVRVNFTILNEGDHAITPLVQVNVYDKNNNEGYRSPYVKINTDLHVGEFLIMPAYVDVSFSGLENTKTLELSLKDENTWPYTPLVSVRKDFKIRNSRTTP